MNETAAIPTPSVPAPDVLRCAYMELIVTDLAASREFYVDILGLVVTEEDDEVIYLRSFEEFIHHNLVLRKGDEAAVAAFAFRVRSQEDVDKAEAYYKELGCETRRSEEGFTTGVRNAVRVQDPLGFPYEFFYETDHVERLAWAAWFCRKHTVHDTALTGGNGPAMHHVAFSTHEKHNILYICDKLGALRRSDAIERGPGRHGVSNAFYLYLRDPDGHRVEIYTQDYYTGDPDNPVVTWDVHDNQRRDWWGHQVVPSWYTEASRVLDLDGNAVPIIEREDPKEMDVTIGADGFSYTRKGDDEKGFKLGGQV